MQRLRYQGRAKARNVSWDFAVLWHVYCHELGERSVLQVIRTPGGTRPGDM
ncbi:hypothetical protein ACFLSJ_07995 [Verrucomicrobiota bacterium]